MMWAQEINLEFIHKIIGIQVSGTKICLVYFG